MSNNSKDKIIQQPVDTLSPDGSKLPGTIDTAGQGVLSQNNEVASFIAQMKAANQGRGRLIFAMDATMSRQPTWDMALALQGDMFESVAQIGGLDVQLVYFRGFKECRSSKWVSNPASLTKMMTSVKCAGGLTQIGKVLSHTRQESEVRRVNALVYVGDAMEENIDQLCQKAGELALIGVPVFLFQEGHNREAEATFLEIASLTKGAFCRFDTGSAAQLRALLSAVAVFAAGGRQALEDFGRSSQGRGAQLLIEQMK